MARTSVATADKIATSSRRTAQPSTKPVPAAGKDTCYSGGKPKPPCPPRKDTMAVLQAQEKQHTYALRSGEAMTQPYVVSLGHLTLRE